MNIEDQLAAQAGMMPTQSTDMPAEYGHSYRAGQAAARAGKPCESPMSANPKDNAAWASGWVEEWNRMNAGQAGTPAKPAPVAASHPPVPPSEKWKAGYEDGFGGRPMKEFQSIEYEKGFDAGVADRPAGSKPAPPAVPPTPGPGVVAASLQQEGIDRANAAAYTPPKSPFSLGKEHAEAGGRLDSSNSAEFEAGWRHWHSMVKVEAEPIRANLRVNLEADQWPKFDVMMNEQITEHIRKMEPGNLITLPTPAVDEDVVLDQFRHGFQLAAAGIKCDPEYANAFRAGHAFYFRMKQTEGPNANVLEIKLEDAVVPKKRFVLTQCERVSAWLRIFEAGYRDVDNNLADLRAAYAALIDDAA